MTITNVDDRLERCVARLVEARDNGRNLKERADRYIWWGAIGCYAILVWIATQ